MIDTEALRKKVIDLALQGKLTEQLPSDGDAETLYAQILDHKSQLIKEGKIKKDKALPDVAADEIPFDIPDNWKWVRLRDICKKIVDGDHNPPSGVKEKTEYLMLSAQNISNDRLENLDSARYLTKDVFAEENKRTNLEIGDVLLTIVATLGRSCVYREKYNVCFQRSVCVISTLILPEFLKRFFDSGYIQKLMKDGATGAAQPGFYLNKVEKMCVPLPPLEEQKRIVDKIESTIIEINHIDELQAKYSNDLAVLKSKIIDAGIQGKLTEQLPEDGDAEDLYAQILNQKSQLIKEGKIKKEKPLPDIAADVIPFEIPKNWKWVRIASVGLTVTGTTPPKENKEYYYGEYPFFKPSDLDAGRHISVGSESLTNEGWKVSRQLRKGSILVCCIGTIGKGAIIDVDGTTNQQINAITPILCDSDYLLYAIESDSFQKQLQQGSRATTVTIIKKSKFDECIIPLPSLSEQKRIAERINELLSMMELIEE